MSGHMAVFIQYFNSTMFPQFIDQAILHPFYLSKKMAFPTILKMESITYLINLFLFNLFLFNNVEDISELISWVAIFLQLG